MAKYFGGGAAKHLFGGWQKLEMEWQNVSEVGWQILKYFGVQWPKEN